MISTRAHIAIIAAALLAFMATLIWPLPPGPSITVVKTKQIDARELIK